MLVIVSLLKIFLFSLPILRTCEMRVMGATPMIYKSGSGCLSYYGMLKAKSDDSEQIARISTCTM